MLAFLSYSPAAKMALASIVGVITVTLYATTSSRELAVRQQMVPFAAIDDAVGAHCTLMPIMLESRPITPTGEPIYTSYGPFFQAANRLELAKDRVVLFNFLARLEIYPVKYRAKRRTASQPFPLAAPTTSRRNRSHRHTEF